MVPEAVCRGKIADLANCLPSRDGSAPESETRFRAYYRHLGMLDVDDFVEACDRIIIDDEWFPTIARIRAVAAECRSDRNRSKRATAYVPPLVCPYCHGARWVRLGGYDADTRMSAGDEGSRVQPCPKCTSAGRLDAYQEAHVIREEGGVPNENAPKEVDLSRRTWSVPRTADGRVDTEALYRQSRVLRGLDPNGDDRPRGVGEWKTLGDMMIAPVEPERELVAVGADDDWSVDSDDIPF
jgi:hypothetical protein